MSSMISDYLSLFDRFLNGALPVEEFQSIYINRFKNEEQLDEPMFELLDELFGYIDSFTEDKSLLSKSPNFYIDERGLREKVWNAREILLRVNTQ